LLSEEDRIESGLNVQRRLHPHGLLIVAAYRLFMAVMAFNTRGNTNEKRGRSRVLVAMELKIKP
jgi:hypothetical protein